MSFSSSWGTQITLDGNWCCWLLINSNILTGQLGLLVMWWWISYEIKLWPALGWLSNWVSLWWIQRRKKFLVEFLQWVTQWSWIPLGKFRITLYGNWWCLLLFNTKIRNVQWGLLTMWWWISNGMKLWQELGWFENELSLWLIQRRTQFLVESLALGNPMILKSPWDDSNYITW